MDEIHSWLEIRIELRDNKQYGLADKVRKIVESIYGVKVIDTKESVTFLWNEKTNSNNTNV